MKPAQVRYPYKFPLTLILLLHKEVTVWGGGVHVRKSFLRIPAYRSAYVILMIY
jgi:hypothetical protein